MHPLRRAFVIMPFRKKSLPDGTEVDFDDIYHRLLVPAIAETGLQPHRADADRHGGSIHLDMFQDLLLAEFVVADLTLENANVWYELGVRHALRAGGTVLAYAGREKLPFDIQGQRVQRYHLKDGGLDPAQLETDRKNLTEAILSTLGTWPGHRASPVYQQLPNLLEPDWKTLKIGSVNQFWQQLEAWQNRIEVARRNQRAGDILVLAEETPNSILEFEALRCAAEALHKLQKYEFALDAIDRALELNPEDLKARQLKGMLLGRLNRFEEARNLLKSLSDKFRDGETLGIFARTWKDEWKRLWNAHPQRQSHPLQAGRECTSTLMYVAEAYLDAFLSAPADYFPGINALTFCRLWEYLEGKPFSHEVTLHKLAGGVEWAITVAMNTDKSFWPVLSFGEFAILEGRKQDALDAYARACVQIVRDRNRFALDSARQQINIFADLEFNPEIVSEVSAVLDRFEQQLNPAKAPVQVVVFSGHMIDNPEVRGPGKEKEARFPQSRVDGVAAEIDRRLNRLNLREGDIGLCGGACGGDLLFAEACLKRGMKLELRLARPEREFLGESVTFADRDHFWEEAFYRVKANSNTKVLEMPVELGAAPEGVSVHARCNQWILFTALSMESLNTYFVTLWDGKAGDGPGGTQHMVDLVNRLTGRRTEVVNPAEL